MLIFSRYTYWVGAMIGFAFLLGIMGQTGLLGPFQAIFLKTASPFENVLSGAFSPVAAFLSDAGSINDLQDENARLRIENEDLRNKVTQLQQDAQQVEEFKNALGIQQTPAPIPRSPPASSPTTPSPSPTSSASTRAPAPASRPGWSSSPLRAPSWAPSPP